ncbi:hypothetical protein [Endozoicomonas numazuensis]|uniref:Uncharacterized protein n=1 Tax=Endozoicomonas numazuensis TaxID=1137799 RepID=A0A081NLN9_9GAMM|nr:hypothetical protein [Endozoicomonas numazuensis]KEQ19362.1 hypothetical protein GZ78_05205 [Endozoicomonas numazuensis]
MELKPTEQPQTFVEQMQQNYDPEMTDLVLESYLNSLLKANAIKERGKNSFIEYSVKANREGELVVTRHQQLEQRLVRNNNTLTVYGVGHSLESECSSIEQRCWVFYPDKAERWVEIEYAPKAVKELAKGMGLLIKELQK